MPKRELVESTRVRAHDYSPRAQGPWTLPAPPATWFAGIRVSSDDQRFGQCAAQRAEIA